MPDPYSEFSHSEDGSIQHELIRVALKPLLAGLRPEDSILDAGCGNGWLTSELSQTFTNTRGIDIASGLIEEARQNFPNLDFQKHDLETPLPFQPGQFSAVILNMVLHNIKNPVQALTNISKVMKKDGLLLLVCPNPYYTFPAAVWKRGLFQKIFGLKPSLILKAYNSLLRSDRNYIWSKDKIPMRFTPLPEQINACAAAGLTLTQFLEIRSESDSKKFNLNYRAFRFPIFLLIAFKKTG